MRLIYSVTFVDVCKLLRFWAIGFFFNLTFFLMLLLVDFGQKLAFTMVKKTVWSYMDKIWKEFGQFQKFWNNGHQLIDSFQCYVVTAAQMSNHNPKRSSFGRSLIVDPGCCSFNLYGQGSWAFVTADIDVNWINQVPVFERLDVYLKVNFKSRAFRIWFH